MKNIIMGLFLTVCLAHSSNVFADELSEDEKNQLKDKIEAMYTSFESGDPSVLIDSTHDSLIAAMGGQVKFAETFESAIDLLEEQQIKFISAELGVPTQLYDAGEEVVSMVPRISVLTAQGQTIRSEGFIVAIRPKGSADSWSFLDSSGFRQNKELLWNLLPDLDRDIKLPINTLEIIEPNK